MGLFTRPDSPFYWALLEGTGRRKINTRVPHAALTSEGRKALKIAAEAIYHQHMVNLAKRGVGLPVETSVTFEQYATWYDTHVISTHRSARSERSTLGRLRAFFGPTLLPDIRPSLVSEYEAVRLKTVKRSTVNQEIAMLRAMLRKAEGEHFETSPLAKLRLKRQRLAPKRTITAAEEAALLTALRTVDTEIHDMYVVGVGSLLRLDNLATLRRHQLRVDRLVVDAKAGPHTISLTGPCELQTRALETLRARLPKAHDGFFFPSWGAAFDSDDQGVNSRFLSRVRKAFNAVGLPWGLEAGGLVWHSATRATGATRMLREYRIDVRTVQLMGPWTSLDQMAEYLGLPAAFP